MDCTGVALHLVAYHLGTVTDEERDTVEAHLLGCAGCLKTYLALKRAADRAESDRPRPEVKAKLRAAVAKEFGRRPAKAPLFARRIPLYQGIALAAIAAAVALFAPSVVRRATSRTDRAGAAAAIDSARTQAESLHIY